MPYFKDTNAALYCLSDADIANGGESLLPALCVAITDAQAYAIQNPPLTLAQAQTVQIALMDTSYNAAITAPIAYMATTFQADKASMDLITQVLSAQAGVAPTGFAWWDINNVAITMTNAQLQGLSNAIFMRGLPLFVHKQTQKVMIRAATTVTQVQAVVW